MNVTNTAKAKDVEVSETLTTLNEVVENLATIHHMTVQHTADIMNQIIHEYISSETFVSGFLGEGFKIWKDDNGLWNGEFDKLTIRKTFAIFELVVQKVVHQGGMIIRSAAGGKLVKVTDGGTYWKCEHDSTDDFVADDQILCQLFTGTVMKRYWRKVTSAGVGYFNLSKSDCEAGSAEPDAGDNVAVLGNRTNTSRQSAQIDCSVGIDAPYRDDYAGINSYSLVGKLINRTGNLTGITDVDFGVLSGSGLYGMNVYLKGIFRLLSGKTVETAINDSEQASKDYADTKLLDFVDKVSYNDDINGLQSQIDGSITTWFYNYIPTTSNIPASNWTTIALKNQHLGDLFYDTTSGYSYRYLLSSGIYSWQKITDTDVTKALADAAAAQDTADGKRRVFVSTPTIPYDIGDLWAQGSSGEIMRCITARTSGSYTASDWGKASKYTDDTLAQTAKDAAANAQSDANTANSLLADIASDSKLTAVEKQSVATEWNNITGEYSKNITKANSYSVSTTAYTTAYNALNSYITPLIASLTTTSTIVAATFRANFKAYYDARTDLLNTIYDAVKTSANTYSDGKLNTFKTTTYQSDIQALQDSISLKVSSSTYEQDQQDVTQRLQAAELKITDAAIISTVSSSIQTAVDNVQVGGTNLLRSLYSQAILENNSYIHRNLYLHDATKLIVGEYYTLSFNGDLESSGCSDWYLNVNYNGVYPAFMSSFKKRSDGRWYTTGICPSGTNPVALGLYAAPLSSTHGNVKTWNIKLERGNKATDYTPAPEDVDSAITAAQTTANNAVPTATYNTKMTQLDNSISAKAESSVVTGINNRLNTAEASITPEAINLTVSSSIQTAVNNIEIGGRNLIRFANIPGAVVSGKYNDNTGKEITIVANNNIRILNWTQSDIGFYSLSFWVKSTIVNTVLNIDVCDNHPKIITLALANTWYWFSNEALYTTGYLGDPYYGFVDINPTISCVLTVCNFKLERGSKCTTYTPAPEDVDASIALRPTTAEITSSISLTNNTISILSHNIDISGATIFNSLATQTAAQGYADTAELAAKNNIALKLGYASYADMVSKVSTYNTIIDGNKIRTSLIDADAIVTNGLSAKTIDAQNAIISNLTITNATVKGSLRNPFTYVSDISVDYNDNVVMLSSGSSWQYGYNIPWDINQSGRCICICNYKWGSSVSTGQAALNAPSAKYFYEDGKAKTQLNISRELIELMGYGDTSTFYGWIVVRRVDLMTEHSYGKQLKLLAQGIVHGTNATATFASCVTFDGSTLSVGRLDEGRYRISFSSAWGLISGQYGVMLTGYGQSYNKTNCPIKATIESTTNVSFIVDTSDDASRNDGDFMFQIINLNDWLI
ncbi:hypothetical protein [uncultured Bacteroides sp.]|uniref:hypothetical protein n=1 Tax=uncultured Bacteroides sp. TaxID=162156 RepID=UPI002AA683F3|nr:hypothetical protein [uncultured Bacteroides sp.]